MAAPNRAPRRTAAQMNITIATGVPTPGAKTYQAQRKTASVGDAKTAEANRATPTGLTPGNVAVNKDTSP